MSAARESRSHTFRIRGHTNIGRDDPGSHPKSHPSPVSIEFGRVLTDMRMGKARSEAFDNLRRRLNDDEIGSIVGAILQSEELGTPLSDIFRTQADVLRVKRSQRAETIAGEAAVSMLLPGILVMMATVLIILGPFVLNVMQNDIGF